MTTGSVWLWPGATLNLDGGTVRLTALASRGGRVNFNSGVVSFGAVGLTADETILNTLLGPGRELGLGRQIEAGSISLTTSLKLTGGTLDVGTALVNNGQLVLDSPLSRVIGTSISNSGALGGTGQVDAPLANLAVGQVRVADGDYLTFSGTGNTNAGLIDVNGQNVLTAVDFSGDLTNEAAGRIEARGGALLRFDGGLANDGIVSAGFANATVTGPVVNNNSIGVAFSNVTFSGGDLTNSGLIAILDQSRVLFADDVIDVSGDIFVSEGSSAVFFGSYNGGTSGTGDVTIMGDLAPGASPGLARFGGDLAIGGVASLTLELAGTQAGREYDQLVVEGQLLAGGTLDVVLLDGFVPRVGATFDVLSFGSVDGAFSRIDLPALGHGLSFDASSLLMTGQLLVVPEPTGVALLGLGLAGCWHRRQRGSSRR